MAPPSAYEVRCTLASARGLLFLASVVLTAGAILSYEQPVILIAGVIFFGFATIVLGAPLVTRAIALTVDARGVAFDTEAPLPWPDIIDVGVERHKRQRVVSVTLTTGHHSRATDGWRLDEPRFWAVVEHYAPHLGLRPKPVDPCR